MKAVVTGGCSGLGLKFTKELLNRGYQVYALYNTSIDSALELENTYDNVRSIKCDIKNETLVEATLFNIDEIDLLINNAAIASDNYYLDKTKREFLKVLETNLVGNFLVTKNALNKMNKNGTIINISSNNAIDAGSHLSMDYDASKAGVNILTKDFAKLIEEEHKGVRIVSICPGWINTESVKKMNPQFLKEELKKQGQQELLEEQAVVTYILDNLKNYQNGEIRELKNMER